ncbi:MULTISPECIES: HDOD domain-containing protein [Deefgea]|uniref:HDOD domain-containing protein n=1 Tax=Deefgea chitinilytica TaxID=570276 RepID=A0ABS2CGN7_9NEIS|nr:MULTISPECIES: HDOD domain-containing protein [Deefgea]MBM5572556.1 HDOD domain-containing protein [Deefgea chitinilytica]MBM9889792.1 HDOD domain-containing protein [Deefgea sp. CFH1-16]
MIVFELVWNQQQHWVGLFAHHGAEYADQLGAALLNQELGALSCFAIGNPQQQLTDSIIAVEASNNGITLPNQGRLHFHLQNANQIKQLNTLDLACGAWYTAASSSHHAANPSKPILLELLSLIVSDAETSALESTLAKAPQLMLHLLKLVNSVGMGNAAPARSIRQAITILGRRQLQRWLQLLLYAEQYGEADAAPVILIAAAMRGKRLALWAEQGWLGNTSADEAFLCGMLSLLDRLFGEPLEQLLAPLPLETNLRLALLKGDGLLGHALQQLAMLEAGEIHHPVLKPLLAKQASWINTDLKAITWVQRLICGSN